MFLFLTMIDTQEEQDKFRQIYEKYRYLMWYLANDILKDPYLAEDAVQEALLAVAENIGKLGEADTGKTRNFIATVAKNKAIDLWRKKKGIILEEYEEGMKEKVERDTLELYLEKEAKERIVNAVLQLEEQWRVMLEYKYLHEMSEKEIAALLGITKKAANVRIFRARQKLKAVLSKEVAHGE